MNQYQGQQQGFTVIELLATATIVGLLVTIVSPSVGDFTNKAKLASLQMNARVVESVIVGYGVDHGDELPTSRAQYVSSPTYKRLINPFSNQAGIGSWSNPDGASTEDNANPQAPVAIWNVDPETLILEGTVGVVFYVPYRTREEARSGVNGLPIGGNGGSHSYTAYTIQAMAWDQHAGIVVPDRASRLINW